MAGKTMKLWSLLVSVVGTFEGKGAARVERAPRAQDARVPTYGISSMLPPMR